MPALEFYAKAGLAHDEAAVVTGLHSATQAHADSYAVLDLGLRRQLTPALKLRYDYESKRLDKRPASDWDNNKLKLYWTPAGGAVRPELYAAVSHYAYGHDPYLVTQEAKPRLAFGWRGGRAKAGLLYRDKDYHRFDSFDSTAFGFEASFRRNGLYAKLSGYEQDTVRDDFDRRELKVSVSAPFGKPAGPMSYKWRYELRGRDYFKTTSATQTGHEWRHKLRGEASRRLAGGWRLRTRLQLTDRHTDLAATDYRSWFGEVALIYRRSGARDGDDNN